MQAWVKEFYKTYIDPDSIWFDSRTKEYRYSNEAFYFEYRERLSKRSNKFDVLFYSKCEPGLIVRNKVSEEKFWLKSDQFGFSAPSPKLNHPYDSYLQRVEKTGDEHRLIEAQQNVRSWILQTRIIGGSFFWPIENSKGRFNLNPKYNLVRGGTRQGRGGSYIEDRVDLTLWELYEIYESGAHRNKEWLGDYILRENMLYRRCFTQTMRKWLSQFDSFGEYISFFGLAPFIDSNTGVPYDLLSEPLEPLTANMTRKRVLYNEEMSIERYEMLFNRIAKMTKERNIVLSQNGWTKAEDYNF